MNFIKLASLAEKNGIVYFTSHRWGGERIVALLTTEPLGLISVDFTSDEGVIGNTFDEVDFGNRSGRFLNQSGELFMEDFILTDKESANALVDEWRSKLRY